MKTVLVLLAVVALGVTGCQSPDVNGTSTSTTTSTTTTNQIPSTKPPWPPPSPNTMNNPPPTVR